MNFSSSNHRFHFNKLTSRVSDIDPCFSFTIYLVTLTDFKNLTGPMRAKNLAEGAKSERQNGGRLASHLKLKDQTVHGADHAQPP
jgi:hypothetical protein